MTAGNGSTHASKLQLTDNGHLKHLLTINGLGADRILSILDNAKAFAANDGKGARKVPLLRGVSVVNLFFEYSTRTRSTFEIAASRLSADILNFNIDMAAVHKGESLLDTLKTLEAMNTDMFIVRHSHSGAAAYIANHVRPNVNVINAGDGRHAHPTQALLDMYTIREHKGDDFSSLCVVIVGDVLHSRVIRSDIAALNALGVGEVRVVAPPTLMPVKAETLGVKVYFDLDSALRGADVIMTLRLQKERMQSRFLSSEEEYHRYYGITKQRMALADKRAIVMHPGPINRGVEISSDVADEAQSVILEQASYGTIVRMSVMTTVADSTPKANNWGK